MIKDPYPVSPQSASDKEVGFEPQKKVRWFTPADLTRAGIKLVLSKLFGAYADNREIQALRPGEVAFDHAQHDELWLDYVADIGDGWDATYSIARLMAEPTLALEAKGEEHHTQKGDVLIMGGDQVYPTATREEYKNRLVGPYRSAFSWHFPEEEAPWLYAIPGNHDWYDGLTSFMRLFCQKRWIGGWRTRQSRSYFALQLPHNWWLWGIDVQLDSDIDSAQLDFFVNLGKRLQEEGTEARIILCVAEPLWVHAETKSLDDYDNLAVFEERAITCFGHTHEIGLSGDLHAYARYASTDGKQRFVSGGGGAYLYPTHRLPEELHVPKGPQIKDPELETFTLAKQDDEHALFPPAGRSFMYALRSIFFAVYNPRFTFFLGLFYLFVAWIVQSAGVTNTSLSLFSGVAELELNMESIQAFIYSQWHTVSRTPLALLNVSLFVAGLVAYANAHKLWHKAILGGWHASMHGIAFLVATWFSLQLSPFLSGAIHNSLLSFGEELLFAGLMVFIGGGLAGVVWGIYLFISHQLGRDIHSNDVLVCQSRVEYKHFLRLHINTEGELTIYPIGLEDVPRKWEYQAGVGGGKPWFEPKDDSVIDRAKLIERPVKIRKTAAFPADNKIEELET